MTIDGLRLPLSGDRGERALHRTWGEEESSPSSPTASVASFFFEGSLFSNALWLRTYGVLGPARFLRAPESTKTLSDWLKLLSSPAYKSAAQSYQLAFQKALREQGQEAVLQNPDSILNTLSMSDQQQLVAFGGQFASQAEAALVFRATSLSPLLTLAREKLTAYQSHTTGYSFDADFALAQRAIEQLIAQPVTPQTVDTTERAVFPLITRAATVELGVQACTIADRIEPGDKWPNPNMQPLNWHQTALGRIAARAKRGELLTLQEIESLKGYVVQAPAMEAFEKAGAGFVMRLIPVGGNSMSSILIDGHSPTVRDVTFDALSLLLVGKALRITEGAAQVVQTGYACFELLFSGATVYYSASDLIEAVRKEQYARGGIDAIFLLLSVIALRRSPLLKRLKEKRAVEPDPPIAPEAEPVRATPGKPRPSTLAGWAERLRASDDITAAALNQKLDTLSQQGTYWGVSAQVWRTMRRYVTQLAASLGRIKQLMIRLCEDRSKIPSDVWEQLEYDHRGLPGAIFELVIKLINLGEDRAIMKLRSYGVSPAEAERLWQDVTLFDKFTRNTAGTDAIWELIEQLW